MPTTKQLLDNLNAGVERYRFLFGEGSSQETAVMLLATITLTQSLVALVERLEQINDTLVAIETIIGNPGKDTSYAEPA